MLQGLDALHVAAQHGRADHTRELLFCLPNIDARSSTVRCCIVYANQWHARSCHLEPKGSCLLRWFDPWLHAHGYTIVAVVLVQTLMIEVSCAAHSCASIKSVQTNVVLKACVCGRVGHPYIML